LEVEGEATTEGTRIEQYTDTGKDHQRWRLKPAGPGNDGFYNIENVRSAMSLEVVGYSKDTGAEIVQRPYSDGPLHRQWELVPVAGKTDVYKIVNRNSGLVLDDVRGQKDAPAPVKQYGSWNDDGRQQWKFISVPASATPAPALVGVLKYGDKVHLQNGYANWQGGYLDACGHAPAPSKYGVFTSDSKDRDTGSGTWEIISATGKAVSAEVLVNDAIHLRNLYGDNGGYLDVCGHANCGGNKYLVSTSDSKDRDTGSGSWRVYAGASSPPDSTVREGDPVHLLNGYANWQGGYLDACGHAPAPSKYGVSTSDSRDRDTGSGTWKFSKA
jgi:Ricin-type beta-trefoil lectin domain-like